MKYEHHITHSLHHEKQHIIVAMTIYWIWCIKYWSFEDTVKKKKYDIVAAIHNICSFMSLKLADSKFVCHAASFHNHFSFSVHLNIILGFWILFILWACNNLALIINQLSSSSIIKNKWHLSTIITLLTHGANAQVKVQVLIT